MTRPNAIFRWSMYSTLEALIYSWFLDYYYYYLHK